MTDEELNALVARLDDMSDLSRDHAAGLLDLGHKVAVNQAISAITTLRAQLADAREERDEYHSEAMTYIEKWGAALKAQDEAEAALAARQADLVQILKCDEKMIFGEDYEVREAFGEMRRIARDAIAQPHDRTALDRMLAEAREQTALSMVDVMTTAAKEAREKALREAAEILDDEGWVGLSMRRIRALIEKEKAE